jgi:hypothetical protein
MVSKSYTERRRRLPDDEIVRLYVEGLDSDSVGARANCSGTAVLGLVRAAGYPVRQPGGRKHDVALPEDEICRRYLSGQSGPVIARVALCTPSSVYNILKKHGVPRRAGLDQVAAAAAATARRSRRP